MTAVSVYDVLARSTPTVSSRSSGELAGFAETLAQASLQDLQRVEECERRFAKSRGRTGETELDLLRSIWRLYDDWVREAEQVIERTRRHVDAGEPVPSHAALVDAYGRVRAILGLSPERLIRARQQIRDGQGIPAKELRDELRARLRA